MNFDANDQAKKRLGGLALVRPAGAEVTEKLTLEASEGGVSFSRHAAQGFGKQPGVAVLHGARGVELKPRAYERYANALTAEGIDAYLIRYYSSADDLALKKLTTPESRETYRTGRSDAWTGRVSGALTAILTRPDSSGRLVLLGFSLGSWSPLQRQFAMNGFPPWR